jgi:hypothetical protein
LLELVGKHRHMRRPLGCDPTIFSEVTPDRVDELGPLPHQQVTGPKHQTRSLLLFALHRHEPHARALRRFADRLGIDRVVLMPFHKRLYIGGWDQPDFVAKLGELTGPVMRSTARLERYSATRLGREEIQQLSALIRLLNTPIDPLIRSATDRFGAAVRGPPQSDHTWKAQLLEGAAGVFGTALRK